MDGDGNGVSAATEDVDATFKVKVPTTKEVTEKRKVVKQFNTERSAKMKQHSLEKSHMQVRIRELGVKAYHPAGMMQFGAAEQDMSGPLQVTRMKSEDQVSGLVDTVDTPRSPPQLPTAGLRLTLPLQRRQSHDRIHRVTSLGIQPVATKPQSSDDQISSEVPQSKTQSSPLTNVAQQTSVDDSHPTKSPKALSANLHWRKRLSENHFLSTPPTVRRYPQQAKEKKMQPRTASKTPLLPDKNKKSQSPGLLREKSPRPGLTCTLSLPLNLSEEQAAVHEGEDVQISVVPLLPAPSVEETWPDENRSTIPSLPPIDVPDSENTAEQTTAESQQTNEDEDTVAIGEVVNQNVPKEEGQDEEEADTEPVQDLATRVEKWINKLAFTTKSASYGDLHTGKKLGFQSQNASISRNRSYTVSDASDSSGTGLAERRASSRLSGSQEGQPLVGLTLGSLTGGLITPQSPRDAFLSPTQRARLRHTVKSASWSSLAPSRDPRESIFSEGVAAPPEGALDETAPVGPIRSPHFLHPSTCSNLKPCNVVDRIEATTGKKGVLAWLGLGTEDVHRIMRRASLIREEQEFMRKISAVKTGDGTNSNSASET